MKTTCIYLARLRVHLVCFLFLFIIWLQQAAAQTPTNYGWQVGYGYSVGATLVKGDTMYIGGDFDYVGHYTGSLVEADLSGAGKINTPWPVVNGVIRAMISDGSGGWFIGGDFTLVNGYTRKGLAHITAAKQIDLSWNINVNNGARIDALLLSPAKDILWAGGTFSSIGGVTNNKVAAINVASKSVVSGWGPGSAIGDNWWATGTVSALAYYTPIFGLPGDVARLFIGGDFRNASWQESHLTALNPATGAVISGWKSDLNHYGNTCCGAPVTPVVRSLLVYGRNLYIGGLFSTITDKTTTLTRQSIAKMDVYTDVTDNTFNADITPKNDSGLINCIKLVNTPLGVRLAIAGKFSNSNARGVQNFTITDPGFGLCWPYQNGGSFVNGLVVDTTFVPGTYQTGEIYSFDTAGTTIYLAGNFEGIKGSGSTVNIRRNLAAFNMQTNAISGWGPVMQTDMPVRSIIVSGGTVFVAGSFTSAGGWLRKNMAAVDLKKDTILSCNPQPDSYVNAFDMSPSKDTLYIGGNFANMGGVQRGYTAAINVNTNTILPWSTTNAAGGGVEDIKLDPVHHILYAGGKFTSIGGQSKTHLAALNAVTGAVINGWTANVTTINSQITPVRTLAISATGDTLYVGGRFNTLAGQSRANLAAIKNSTPGLPSTSTATLLSWNFPVTQTIAVSDIGVCALHLSNGMLYVGGKFDAINGNSSLKNLAAINVSAPVHSVSTTWAPLIEYGGVWCMQTVGSQLYIGGDFGSVNSVTTSFAAALNITDGSIVAAWTPFPTRGLGGVVLSLMINDKWIYLGGNQEAMTQNINDAVLHLATIARVVFAVLPVQNINLTVKNTAEGNLASWQTNWINAFIELERSTDGVHFSPVAFNIKATGQFTDRTVRAGNTYYYRLKNTTDATITYSTVRSISLTNESELFISTWVRNNNPIKVRIESKEGLLMICTPSGQQVMRQTLKQGFNEISRTKLSSGIYFYSVMEYGRISGTGKLLLE
jgi:hypothetical protein